jgi:hypothetical protein
MTAALPDVPLPRSDTSGLQGQQKSIGSAGGGRGSLVCSLKKKCDVTCRVVPSLVRFAAYDPCLLVGPFPRAWARGYIGFSSMIAALHQFCDRSCFCVPDHLLCCGCPLSSFLLRRAFGALVLRSNQRLNLEE